MATYGRPPDGHAMLDRVKSGLADWYLYHYGKGDQKRMPELAQGVAGGIAALLREEVRTKRIETEHRNWAENVASGAETLARVEVDVPLVLGYETGDAIDRLELTGSREREEHDAEIVRRIQTFIAGAGLAGFTAYVLC